MSNQGFASRVFARRRWLAPLAAALLATAGITAVPGPAHASVFVSVSIAPPPLPVYAQPMIPGPGYLWTPGYWAWSGGGYYWVPGTWVLAPFVGALWTPGYWGWGSGAYIFHAGYWGTRIGFYGGINYSYGYGGHGYDGGYWRGGGFYYNRSVNRVNTRITNVYNKTVINNHTTINRVSYNGGAGGIAARATPQQQAWARDRRSGPVAAQLQQRDTASRMDSMRANVNHGTPPIAATTRAGQFSGRGVVAAHGAPQASAFLASRVNPEALHSAGFAPHAYQGTGTAAATRDAAPARSRGPDPMAPRANGALRSASFAPHAADDGYRAANHRGEWAAPRDAARGGYDPQGHQPMTRDEPSIGRAQPYRPQRRDATAEPVRQPGYGETRDAMTPRYQPAPRESQAYRAPTYRTPQSRPAAAPRPQPAARHEKSERDQRH